MQTTAGRASSTTFRRLSLRALSFRPRTFQIRKHHWFLEYIGPFWCLRAALGPLVETYILLDRLLFLQEQSNLVEALLFPLFDPTMSPRNMAIIAWKLSANSSEA